MQGKIRRCWFKSLVSYQRAARGQLRWYSAVERILIFRMKRKKERMIKRRGLRRQNGRGLLTASVVGKEWQWPIWMEELQSMWNCRLCGSEKETMMHIICRCKRMKANRIARHNKVCNLLAEVGVEFGWDVEKEMRLVSSKGKVGVPDLVFRQGKEAIILDVTVRYEREEKTLAKAAAEKVGKYTPFERVLKRKLGEDIEVETWGFPMGVRGLWYNGNYQLLKRLGAKKARASMLAKAFSRRTLFYSYSIYRAFIKLAKGKGR